ncbi:hypothetical protein IscW_ISCW024415 [Ixodes scapularis]|uniref:Uncharacterized protein n=1 Tax=Ixodes scapularis TaxID=6945 RepID=B7PLD7_IXOSC|nr:hypothetical protein IscW_ISCW024415 [Ixodes scapularis]|eukprot:XP_002434585.1 hypothetical protein IscW_ISCW024415 [Ixodes scapularis]
MFARPGGGTNSHYFCFLLSAFHRTDDLSLVQIPSASAPTRASVRLESALVTSASRRAPRRNAAVKRGPCSRLPWFPTTPEKHHATS